MQPGVNPMSLGRRMLVAVTEVAENLDIFHKWVPEASAEVQGVQMKPVMAGGQLVAVESPFGRIEVAREFTRVGDALFARVIFFEPSTALRKEPREIYSIRISHEGGLTSDQGQIPTTSTGTTTEIAGRPEIGCA